MKRNSLLTITLSLAGALSLATASAQSASNSGLTDLATFEDKMVTDLQGNTIGDVEEILVDSRSGRVRYIVVEVDKAWNWNDPQVAVPFGAFQIEQMGDIDVSLKLDTTKERLAESPKFQEGDAQRLSDRTQSEPYYTFWSVVWYDDAETSSDTSSNASPSASPMASPAASPSASPMASPSPNPTSTPTE